MKTKEERKIEKFLLYPSSELLERLRAEAKKEQRSVNGEVRWILEHYFAQKDASVE